MIELRKVEEVYAPSNSEAIADLVGNTRKWMPSNHAFNSGDTHQVRIKREKGTKESRCVKVYRKEKQKE